MSTGTPTADPEADGEAAAGSGSKKGSGISLQSMSAGIKEIAESNGNTSTGWQTAAVTAISGAGSILSLVANNTSSKSVKSALVSAGGIVGLLTNVGSSASGLITPQEEHDVNACYAWLQQRMGGPLSTLLLTLLGVVGSICTLVAADTSLPHKTTKGLLLAGSIVAIVFNLLSSIAAHITPMTPKSPKAGTDADIAPPTVIVHTPGLQGAAAHAVDLGAMVERLFQAVLEMHKAKTPSVDVNAK